MNILTKNIRLIIPLIGIALLANSCLDAATYSASLYEEGMDFYNKKNYSVALKLFQKAAKAGNGEAMNFIGRMYEKGSGVSIDYQKAMDWYQKGTKAGSTTAMNNIGWMYDKGEGVSEDDRLALEWYKKAEAAGSPDAVENIAELQRPY
jgi:TPR repeat protein